MATLCHCCLVGLFERLELHRAVNEHSVQIGVAVHVDHGKTTLVRASTGIDTDRKAEEEARGLSIESSVAEPKLSDGLCHMEKGQTGRALLARSLGTRAASSDGYNFISAKELKNGVNGESSMIIIDICPVEQFAKRHIKRSLETNAYPVKTKEEKARLAEFLSKIKASTDDVVIVCPRGGGGAKGTFDFYNANGVEKSRLLILERGMDAWPYETEKNNHFAHDKPLFWGGRCE